jgi:hypothetical protein
LSFSCFWKVLPFVNGHQGFEGTCCFHLHFYLEEWRKSSATLVTAHENALCHDPAYNSLNNRRSMFLWLQQGYHYCHMIHAPREKLKYCNEEGGILHNRILRNSFATILDLGLRWRSVVSFMPLSLYTLGKNSRYPLYKRLGRPQNRSGRCGVIK